MKGESHSFFYIILQFEVVAYETGEQSFFTRFIDVKTKEKMFHKYC